MSDSFKFSEAARPIRNIVRDLRDRFSNFPELKFTPDGHMVGDLGVAIASEKFDLEPAPQSTEAHDAYDPDGQRVEVKATGGTRSVSFRRIRDGTEHPNRLIVLRFDWDKSKIEWVYDGSFSKVYNKLEEGKWPTNGQKQISLEELRILNRS